MDGTLHGDFVSSQGEGGVLLDKESVTSVWIVLYQNPQPWSLDFSASDMAPELTTWAWNLWQEKGERWTSSGITTYFSFGAAYTHSPNPFFDCCICPNSIWTTFGSLDSEMSSAVSHAFSSPALILTSKYQTGQNHGPWDRLCNPLHIHLTNSPVTQVELVYAEQSMKTLVWKNSII